MLQCFGRDVQEFGQMYAVSNIDNCHSRHMRKCMGQWHYTMVMLDVCLVNVWHHCTERFDLFLVVCLLCCRMCFDSFANEEFKWLFWVTVFEGFSWTIFELCVQCSDYQMLVVYQITQFFIRTSFGNTGKSGKVADNWFLFSKYSLILVCINGGGPCQEFDRRFIFSKFKS